jgi:tetratricopeptide (TPR) repeat protein
MALQLNPRSLRAALHLSRLQAVRDPGRALATLEGAVAFAPTHAPTLEAMRRLHEALGATDQAIALYQAAFEASPELSRVATRLGQLYDALGDTAEAARRFEQAALLAPDSADAQLEWAEFLFVSGDLDRASQLCIRAVELDRRHVRARALLGRMISAMERRQGRVA